MSNPQYFTGGNKDSKSWGGKNQAQATNHYQPNQAWNEGNQGFNQGNQGWNQGGQNNQNYGLPPFEQPNYNQTGVTVINNDAQ